MHLMKCLTQVILIGVSALTSLQAQNLADSLYIEARAAAFEQKDNSKALELIQASLDVDSSVAHHQVFKGRILAWDARYAEASVILEAILEQNPSHLDARRALLDVYLWSGKYVGMQSCALDGLKQHPEELTFLFAKGMAELKMDQKRAAIESFQGVLSIDPHHEKALAQLDILKETHKTRKLRAKLSYDELAATQTAWQFIVAEPTMDPWSSLAVEYEQSTSRGPLIGRVTQASRFGMSGTSFDLEAYPSLRPGRYAYVAAGFSQDDLFPDWKVGLEVFQDLKQGFEASLGFRYLKVPSQGVGVLTAAGGKYFGNNWLNLRLFVTPGSESFSRSVNVTLRHYLADADHYIELSGGSGEVPDETLGAEEIDYLGSRRVSLLWQTRAYRNTFLQAQINLQNLEVRTDQYRGMSGVAIGLDHRF